MAGGTKRMSADEKRKVILDIYHKSKSVYTEKEILTLASKAGVNANTVADINQSLIDDGLVDKEKLGGSNYFWSFPAKKDRVAQLQHEKVLAEIATLKTDIDEANAALLDAKRGREDDDVNDENVVVEEEATKLDVDTNEVTPIMDSANSDETAPPAAKKSKTTTTTTTAKSSRAHKLQRLEAIARERAAAVAELEALKDNDPQAIADLEMELQLVKQAANRWTDNIYNCQTYLTKKRGIDKKAAMKMLGITDAFDYPEDKIPK